MIIKVVSKVLPFSIRSSVSVKIQVIRHFMAALLKEETLIG